MPLNNSFFTLAEVAKELAITKGRVSQIRTELEKRGLSVGSEFGNALSFNAAEIELMRRETRAGKKNAHAGA